jgi:hypothetical protein
MVGAATTVAGGAVITVVADTEEADIMAEDITGGAVFITAVAAGTRAAAAMEHAADMVEERVIPGAVDTAHAGISQGVVADMRVVAEEASMAVEADTVAVAGTAAVADISSAINIV